MMQQLDHLPIIMRYFCHVETCQRHLNRSDHVEFRLSEGSAENLGDEGVYQEQ